MKSEIPKVLHNLLGKPIIEYVLESLKVLPVEKTCVVIGHGAPLLKEFLKSWSVEIVHQEEQLGTGHAVLCCKNNFQDFAGDILITCGDTPLFRKEVLKAFYKNHCDSGSVISILSCKMDDPKGYGRIKRNEAGDFYSIVEEKDADPEERKICEVNTGSYIVKTKELFELLGSVKSDNAQGEYYLTDIVSIGKEKGLKVYAFPIATQEDSFGVNSRAQLAQAEKILLSRIRESLMNEGVTFSMPETTYIEPTVIIGRDSFIGPHSILKGRTQIEKGAFLEGFCYIEDSRVYSGEVIKAFSKLIGKKANSVERSY